MLHRLMMIFKISKSRKKLNNKGVTLITVIMIIGFLAILVSILLSVTLVNYKMKQMNMYAKDTFYSAEQVLDEINIGLQNDISSALSTSYTDVLEHYADYDIEKKNTILQTRYYEYLWKRLQTNSTHTQYELPVLESYLKQSTKWHESDSGVYYGAILKTDSGQMITYEDKGIVLKGLTVYYKDINGFVSIIHTDLRIAYPQFDFASSTALPNIMDYTIIADKGIKSIVPGANTIKGNCYSDSIYYENTELNINGLSNLIVKHDIKLKNNKFNDDNNSTVWAQNIVSDSSSAKLAGTTNVSNDLNIKGKNSNVMISNIYNGFGSSATESAKSSAILINGKDSILDLSNIKQITLAGRAFIGTKKNNKGGITPMVNPTVTPIVTPAAGYGNNVLTGESVAVKSNQLMYLIPGECIGVSLDTGIAINKNPLTADEYKTITDPAKYKEVATDIVVSKLGKDLNSYIKTSGTGNVAVPEKVFVQTNGETLVYYYMSFKDEEAANQYFRDYYNLNKEKVDEYIGYYTKEIKFPKEGKVLQLRMAGNALVGNTEEKTLQIQSNTVNYASSSLNSNNQNFQNVFDSLCTKLMENYAELGTLKYPFSESNDVVFDNLIDNVQMNYLINNFVSNPTTAINVVKSGNRIDITGSEGRVIIADDDVNLDNSCGDVHLVIATGNVSISMNSFKGLILTDGIVTVNNNQCMISADSDLVRSMFCYSSEISSNVYPIASILRDGSELVYASSSMQGESSESTNLSDLVIYENWSKE